MDQTLINEFWAPEYAPPSPYAPDPDVVTWRHVEGLHVVLEVYRGADSFHRFRYRAWVAWRDAGGTARAHSWHFIGPDEGIITDDLEAACATATLQAVRRGLVLEPEWHAA